MDKTRDRYAAKVSRGDIGFDAAQDQLAAKLDEVAEHLADSKHHASGWTKFFGRKPDPAARGLYIVGGVGRGKTMLMDLFFAAAPIEAKRRVHFHAFMMDVHARIHAWRQDRKRGVAHGEEPTGVVAEALASEAQLLCFDEFAVTDIADAMLLGRLFTALFGAGVTVVATSNVAPGDLYRDGLNRTLFLPFIALLEQRCEVVRLEAERDFRFGKLTAMPTWFTPADASAEAALDRAFADLAGDADGSAVELRLLGRTLHVPRASGDVARFCFAALCEAPLGSTDYLTIARAYGTVLVDGVRVMAPGERNLAKRFITMIDTFYDEQVKLIASAETEPDALYQAEDGRETFEFRRTVSRLQEMRSAEYLALPHGHGRMSGDASGLYET